METGPTVSSSVSCSSELDVDALGRRADLMIAAHAGQQECRPAAADKRRVQFAELGFDINKADHGATPHVSEPTLQDRTSSTLRTR